MLYESFLSSLKPTPILFLPFPFAASCLLLAYKMFPVAKILSLKLALGCPAGFFVAPDKYFLQWKNIMPMLDILICAFFLTCQESMQMFYLKFARVFCQFVNLVQNGTRIVTYLHATKFARKPKSISCFYRLTFIS